MNLVIEIGNTTTKFGVFEGENLIKFIRYTNDKLVYDEISSYQFDKVIISGSGNIEAIDLNKINANSIRRFNQNFIQNITITYETPNTLGQDRLVNANYASALFPNRNKLIIDVGTCITCTFINSKNELIGGSISPGLQIRFKSLHKYTAKLPFISLDENLSSKLIGKSTEESIISGVIEGAVFELEGRIEQYLAKFDNLSIIMTGGDTHFFQNKIKYQIFADTHFTLKGLNDLLINT
jgi:type III pantothenate kinase